MKKDKYVYSVDAEYYSDSMKSVIDSFVMSRVRYERDLEITLFRGTFKAAKIKNCIPYRDIEESIVNFVYENYGDQCLEWTKGITKNKSQAINRIIVKALKSILPKPTFGDITDIQEIKAEIFGINDDGSYEGYRLSLP